MEKCCEGIYIIGRYGNPGCNAWLFEHNGEFALLEMPPFFKEQGRPIDIIVDYKKVNNLKGPKYIFLSHCHMDHIYSIFHYKKAFPDAKLVIHNSFLSDYFVRCYIYMYWTKNKRIYGEDIANTINLFNEVFSSDIYTVNIGGEPVHLIPAPKHSYEDIMIVFKGAMITGDWAIGPYPDCNDIVSQEHKLNSIDKLVKIMKEINYNIHMLFSVHGDVMKYNVDFYKIMEETRNFCANEVSSNNCIPLLRSIKK